MVEATGRWVSDAIECARRMALVPPADLKAALLREAAVRNLKIVTLRRRLQAARYVEHHLKAGVSCLASVAAIEALMLLERRAPALAVQLRTAVLAGKLTAREMARVAEQEMPGVTTRAFAKDREAFTLSVCEILYDDFKSVDRIGTEKRAFFFADAEINIERPKKIQVALYFSPELPFSISRNHPFSRQINWAVAALAAYDQVAVVLTTQAELKTYSHARSLLRPYVLKRLRLVNHTSENLEVAAQY